MPGANNVTGSDDSDPQFMIIFVHLALSHIAGAKAIDCGRVTFDRESWLRVQPSLVQCVTPAAPSYGGEAVRAGGVNTRRAEVCAPS